MDTRDTELRKQAEAVCRRRTRERDLERQRVEELISYLSTPETARVGLGLLSLLRQIQRLAHVRCPTMGFGTGIQSCVEHLQKEADELLAEELGSSGGRSESLDLSTVALHVCLLQGVEPGREFLDQAEKLRRRLDYVESGGTWENAKLLERAREGYLGAGGAVEELRDLEDKAVELDLRALHEFGRWPLSVSEWESWTSWMMDQRR